MTLPLRLTTEAEQDLRQARSWYLKEAPHKEPSFAVEISATLNRIGERPRMYQVVEQGVRRAVVHRFPFVVFYLVHPELIEVIAVPHQARDPRTWRWRQ